MKCDIVVPCNGRDKSYSVKGWKGRVDIPKGGLHTLRTKIFLLCPLLYLKYSFSYEI